METDHKSSPIAELRRAFQQYLHIPAEDLDVIDFVFAVVVSHRIPGDPLWGMIIDASGGGKTELLRSLRESELVVFVSKLTPKSLKSGYRDPKHPERDPSLLPKLDGKILVIKDLSPILSMNREARNAVISDLRDAYDGFSDDSYGNVGLVGYKSRFSLIAASTLAIERYSSVDQELGERFVKFRARGNGNRAKVERAAENTSTTDEARETVTAAVREFFDVLPKPVLVSLSAPMRAAIVSVADFVATARSSVARDRNHDLLYAPKPEVGTRLVKELTKLAIALAFIRGKSEPDEEDLATVCRVAEDCLSPNRRELLAAIVEDRECRLPDQTARNTGEDLQQLGILTSKNLIERHWIESMRNVRKLLLALPLRTPATSECSSIFNMADETDPCTPSDTAGGKPDSRELAPDGLEAAFAATPVLEMKPTEVLQT